MYYVKDNFIGWESRSRLLAPISNRWRVSRFSRIHLNFNGLFTKKARGGNVTLYPITCFVRSHYGQMVHRDIYINQEKWKLWECHRFQFSPQTNIVPFNGDCCCYFKLEAKCCCYFKTFKAKFHPQAVFVIYLPILSHSCILYLGQQPTPTYACEGGSWIRKK